MSDSKPLIDPKELAPAVNGFVVGCAMLGGFVLLAMALHMPLLAETWMLPRQ